MYKLQYIAGAVIRNVYSKLRIAKNWKNVYNQHCISILLACKAENDTSQKLIQERDRGWLWNVNSNIQNMFKISIAI